MSVYGVDHGAIPRFPIPNDWKNPNFRDPLAHVVLPPPVVATPPKAPTLSWSEKTVTTLSSWETRLDTIMPKYSLQNSLDQVGQAIEDGLRDFFAPVNASLDSNNPQDTYLAKAALFLIRLPFKVLRNDLCIVYYIIKALLYTLTHPIKATLKTLQLSIYTLKHLVKFENWTKAGALILGATLSEYICFATFKNIYVPSILFMPIKSIFMPIAIAACVLMFLGLTASLIQAIIDAPEHQKEKAALECLLQHMEQLPESFLTGLFAGGLLGMLQLSVVGHVTSWGVQLANTHQIEALVASPVVSASHNLMEIKLR